MLTYNDPFRSIDHWLSSMGASSSSDGFGSSLDAYRRGENVWLHFDLPGVDVDSLDIDVERSNLTVSAERRRNREEGDQMYFAERRMGKFRRQVNLGEGLDAEAIEADYHDGVLTLRIPVAEKAKARKVAINTGGAPDAPAIEADVIESDHTS